LQRKGIITEEEWEKEVEERLAEAEKLTRFSDFPIEEKGRGR